VAYIERECRAAGIGCVDCKKRLAKNINAYFAPFRERRAEFAKNPDYVWDVLADGARRARVIAAQTIAEVKEAIGLP
jgi:tryptophanyl-tRNA synthetase